MVTIDQELCIGCGACAEDCLSAYITLTESSREDLSSPARAPGQAAEAADTVLPRVHKKASVKGPCLKCGHCVAVCPVNAVSIPEYDMDDVEECRWETAPIDAEALLRTIKSRRSIRRYKPEKVSEEKLQKLVQAGRYAATAKNLQDCHFVIVQKDLEELKRLVWEQIDRLTAASDGLEPELLPYAGFNERRKKDPEDDYLFRNAPAVIYIFSERGLDAGLAAENMELMAVAEGMGILYNGYLARISDQNTELKKWFGLTGKRIAACMLAGFPDVTYKRTAPRRKANVVLL